MPAPSPETAKSTATHQDKPLPNQPKKPCRVCSDFESILTAGLKGSKPKTPKPAAQKSSIPPTSSRDHVSEADSEGWRCPPDYFELGSHTWTFLHSMASYFPSKPSQEAQGHAKALMKAVSKVYPCESCAQHLEQYIQEKGEPDASSRQALEQWMCSYHNSVNRLLGKTEFDCSRVRERWHDGPADGSCD